MSSGSCLAAFGFCRLLATEEWWHAACGMWCDTFGGSQRPGPRACPMLMMGKRMLLFGSPT